MFTIFHAHNFFQHLRLALWLLQRWLSGKKSICSAGDSGSIPGSGRSPEEEMATHSQYSCRENPTDRGGWWSTVRGVGKSWTWLRDWTYTQTCCRQCFSYCLEYIFSSFFFFLMKISCWWLLVFIYLEMSLFHLHFWKVVLIVYNSWLAVITSQLLKNTRMASVVIVEKSAISLI